MRKQIIFLSSIFLVVFATKTLYGSSEIVFSYEGPKSATQDFSVKLYLDGQLLSTMLSGETVTTTVSNDSHKFDARIGTISKPLVVYEPDKRVYINIVAKITLSGIDMKISVIKMEPLPPPTITITGMDFANIDRHKGVILSYGTSFETTTIKFIKPRITYNNISYSSGNIILDIKIINPDGSLVTVEDSPKGYSLSYSLDVKPSKIGEKVLLTGIDNDYGGTFSVGTYICEVWSNDQRLFRTTFTVTRAIPPIIITAVDFVNTDRSGKIIDFYKTSFKEDAIRYITPQITYNNIGSFSGEKILYIKLFNPDGSLNKAASSKNGYTYDCILYVSAGGGSKRVSLLGWGNDHGGTYSVGTHICEIWCDGQILSRDRFIVTSTTMPTNTRYDVKPRKIINTDVFFNAIGVSIGTSFATPGFISTVHGTFAPIENMYLEFGFDWGLIYCGPNKSEYYSVDGYYSIYPFVNIGYFMPITDEDGWYFGTGVGYMFAKYTFWDGTTDVHRFAINLTTGFNVSNIMDISYTLRTNFLGANHKLSAGLVYRFD
jgi:hypothetical protein